jgi:hypothetical protein
MTPDAVIKGYEGETISVEFPEISLLGRVAPANPRVSWSADQSSMTVTTGDEAFRRIDCVTLPNRTLPTEERFRPPTTM